MTKARGGQPYYLGSFIVSGVAELDVPPGVYTAIAEHGLEYQRVEREISVAQDAPARVTLRLEPWTRMRAKGWWSGDMHVHRTAGEAPGVAQAVHRTSMASRCSWAARTRSPPVFLCLVAGAAYRRSRSILPG